MFLPYLKHKPHHNFLALTYFGEIWKVSRPKCFIYISQYKNSKAKCMAPNFKPWAHPNKLPGICLCKKSKWQVRITNKENLECNQSTCIDTWWNIATSLFLVCNGSSINMDCFVNLLSKIGGTMDVLKIFKQLMDEEQSRVLTNREIRSKMFSKVSWSKTSNTVIAADHWEILTTDGSNWCPVKMKWLLSQTPALFQ